MRKGYLIVVGVIFIASLLAAQVFAAGTSCQTKYPIILAHGMGFTPSTAFPNSFPGIVEALEACGATVYTPIVEGIGSTIEKAGQFVNGYSEISPYDGSSWTSGGFKGIQALNPKGTKFNIIGHSQGGLYTRYAITNLGISPYVASLTTVDSPHRGSYIDQIELDIEQLMPALASLMTGALPFTGSPAQLAANDQSLSITYMEQTFNPNTPNVKGIYYQSFSCAYRQYNILKAEIDGITEVIDALEGKTTPAPTTALGFAELLYNALPDLAAECYLLGGGLGDGLVQVSSAQWGTYLGTQMGPSYSKGLNHLDAVNIAPYGAQWDAVSYWVQLVKNLKAQGY
jgi:triacylglycerol lipase